MLMSSRIMKVSACTYLVYYYITTYMFLVDTFITISPHRPSFPGKINTAIINTMGKKDAGQRLKESTQASASAEALATALLLTMAFSYFTARPDYSQFTTTSILNKYAPDFGIRVDICMTLSLILCSYCLVFRVHLLMLSSTWPLETFAIFSKNASDYGRRSMFAYWASVVFFAVAAISLICIICVPVVATIALVTGFLVLAVGLPLSMSTSAAAALACNNQYLKEYQDDNNGTYGA